MNFSSLNRFWFCFRDQTFLDEQNIPSNRLLSLVVRVKERIVPNHCEFRSTSSTIELTLVKEDPSSRFWGRIDAEEHSETPVKSSAPIALGYVSRRNGSMCFRFHLKKKQQSEFIFFFQLCPIRIQRQIIETKVIRQRRTSSLVLLEFIIRRIHVL